MPFNRNRYQAGAGFTLIELLVVLGIVALLLTLAVPRYFPSVDQARDTILAENLRNTRATITIDQFYGDTGRYPDSLEQLVQKISARLGGRPHHRQQCDLDCGRSRQWHQGQCLRPQKRRAGPGSERAVLCRLVTR